MLSQELQFTVHMVKHIVEELNSGKLSNDRKLEYINKIEKQRKSLNLELAKETKSVKLANESFDTLIEHLKEK